MVPRVVVAFSLLFQDAAGLKALLTDKTAKATLAGKDAIVFFQAPW